MILVLIGRSITTIEKTVKSADTVPPNSVCSVTVAMDQEKFVPHSTRSEGNVRGH